MSEQMRCDFNICFLSFLLLNLQLFSPLLASLVKNVLVFVVVVHFSFFLCGFKKQT